MSRQTRTLLLTVVAVLASASVAAAQSTRLLREPTLSASSVAFTYGADLWIAPRGGGTARRLTATPAVESDPHFSPDGRWIAFTSNRSGIPQVYVVSVDGGDPTRLTWYPATSEARGWTPDGARVLYASSRETAPVGYDRLWTVAPTGGPSTMLPAPWGYDGSYSADGKRIVVDRVTRWDWEWRSYRGGQNTPLTILDLGSLDEVRLPNERTQDRWPVWIGDKVWFVSDRDWAMNVWSYDVGSGDLQQVTHFADAEVKWLNGGPDGLVFEQDGYIHTLDPATGQDRQLDITVQGDFPWAEPRWEDVSDRVGAASLSPTGVRALMEARGEIFTVPVEHGDARNLSRTTGVDDRAAVWSPDGTQVAWFSDDGSGYKLVIAPHDGLGDRRTLDLGVSKLGWEPTWSPDGKRIAFVDDHVRIRVLDVASGDITTADVGGVNITRGSMGITWSPDSKWLAYARTGPNNFRRITAWSVETGEATPLTNDMADAMSPAWDRDGHHLYFLASTNLALGSGWANTSAMQADPTYGAYVMVLRADDATPFPLRSDEEGEAKKEEPPQEEAKPDSGGVEVRIDVQGLNRRIVALPMPVAPYVAMLAGPKGTVFIAERGDEPGITLHKFSLESREAEDFAKGIRSASISADGKKMLLRQGPGWRVVDTGRPPSGNGNGDRLTVSLRMHLDRQAEWRQIFDEAWHYEKDYFYDPGMHGNDWDAVRARYRPLVQWVRHRADLTYVLDQLNGELSVGHSFVGGGDYPDVDTTRVGVLGADLEAADGRWRIKRIYTYESWNPNLTAPLDHPGMKVAEGNYILAVDGRELAASDDPYRLLDGTAGKQTVLYVNDRPTMDGHWTVTVEPIRSEGVLRQRAWVEDNRRRVDELSDGKLAYVWIPNTGGPGVVSFDRYFFAQQDKLGAVIDERYNGGGLLDDYMVDYMTRTIRAAVTNEAPGGKPFILPQGVLGPKALLINERAGSGGDYFPWAFRQQKAGPLIGTRTWGGLVAASSAYPMVDGGYLTAPNNAVFDPINNRWIAENEGVPPDIEVLMDAKSVAEGHDPQLERAVQEVLRMVEQGDYTRDIQHPPYSRPSHRPGGAR
ncbi:MAG: PDZ domain-containing protein [Gemmatimonadota bacterium]|jgi:tricorn protease